MGKQRRQFDKEFKTRIATEALIGGRLSEHKGIALGNCVERLGPWSRLGRKSSEVGAAFGQDATLRTVPITKCSPGDSFAFSG